jgi:GxxExxY protein
MTLIEEELSFEIMNAAYQVHNTLGPGFFESVYEKAMLIELTKRGHQVETQKYVTVRYGNEIVGEHVLDMVVDGKVILELKAVSAIAPLHKQQALAYLRATGLPLAMVINFGAESVYHARVVFTRQVSRPASQGRVTPKLKQPPKP